MEEMHFQNFKCWIIQLNRIVGGYRGQVCGYDRRFVRTTYRTKLLVLHIYVWFIQGAMVSIYPWQIFLYVMQVEQIVDPAHELNHDTTPGIFCLRIKNIKNSSLYSIAIVYKLHIKWGGTIIKLIIYRV